jgi:Trp operon repressor
LRNFQVEIPQRNLRSNKEFSNLKLARGSPSLASIEVRILDLRASQVYIAVDGSIFWHVAACVSVK